MQWIRVEESLPPDGMKVLLLCKGVFGRPFPCDTFYLNPSLAIFEGSFERRRGWSKFFCDDKNSIVIGWMPRPVDIEEKNDH